MDASLPALGLSAYMDDLSVGVGVRAVRYGARHIGVHPEKYVARNDVAPNDDALEFDFSNKRLSGRTPVVVRRFRQILREHPLSPPSLSLNLTQAANRCSYNRFSWSVCA